MKTGLYTPISKPAGHEIKLLTLFLILFFLNVCNDTLLAQNSTNYGSHSGTKGTDNSFFGHSAGRKIEDDGNQNSFFGRSAGYETTDGDRNTFIGRSAGRHNTNGRSNVFVGYKAGNDNTSGKDNVYIGREAGHKAKGSGNVFIGREAGFNEDGDNKLYINNSQANPPIIYGEFGDPGNNVIPRLGINTTNPRTTLHVKYGYYSSQHSPSHVEGLFVENSGESNEFFVFQTANKFGKTFSITNSGQVGIGTSNPPEKLTVKDGNLLMKVADNNNNQNILFQNSGNSFVCNIYRRSTGENDADLVFATGKSKDYTKLSDRMVINSEGNVGIGTSSPQSALAVNGKITTTSIEVTQSGWPDYVFKDDYKLLGLNDVEEFIHENGHLPDVPSEEEIIRNGLNLGEMDAVLLRKVEELTLYIIELKKEVETLRKAQ